MRRGRSGWGRSAAAASASATAATSTSTNLAVGAASFHSVHNSTVVTSSHAQELSHTGNLLRVLRENLPGGTASSTLAAVGSERTTGDAFATLLVEVTTTGTVTPLPGITTFCKNDQRQSFKDDRLSCSEYVLPPPQHCPPIGQQVLQHQVTSATRTKDIEEKFKLTLCRCRVPIHFGNTAWLPIAHESVCCSRGYHLPLGEGYRCRVVTRHQGLPSRQGFPNARTQVVHRQRQRFGCQQRGGSKQGGRASKTMRW